MRYLLLFLFAFAAFCFFPSPLPAQSINSQAKNPFANNPQAISAGRTAFRSICSGYCHGTGKAIRCPNLFDCEWKHGGTDVDIFRTVTEGIKKTEMVGFKGKLPDELLWKIVAYIRSASQCQGDLATPAH